MLHWFIKLLFFPVRFIPRKVELFLGAIVGLILYYVIRFKRKIVRENLLTAYGSEKDIKEIEFKNYIHYGRLVFELLHLPFDAKRFAERNVRVHNSGCIKEAMDKGKGVFFLSAHVGYWEIMSVMAMSYDIPLNIITKYLRIKIFDDIWVRSRESYGIKLIDECFSAKPVLKAIRSGEVVGFVLDQFMGPPVGVKVDFFNKPAWTIASLAWFVKKTGAAVVPVVNYRRGDGTFDLILYPDMGFEAIGSDEEDIKHNTQRYSKVVEGFIREEPAQWIWVHKRWKRTKEDE